MPRWIAAAAAAATLLVPQTVRAQDTASTTSVAQESTEQQKPPAAVGEEGKKPTRGFFSALGHNLVDDLRHMPRRNSVYWLGGGAALALAVHPEDSEINAQLVNRSTDKLWKPAHLIGSFPLMLGGAATAYIVGRATDRPRLQHVGMDEIEAALLAEGFTQGLKIAVRRQRPQEIGGKQSSTYSFPSGHATITFATATVLQQHLGYKAAIPTYLVATYVAMSRLHDNRHYASDVAFGSALGIVIGRSVTWHGRNMYASPMLLPDGAGIQMVLVH